MNAPGRTTTSVHIATARVDSGKANDFVARVNDGLEMAPYYELDNPIVAEALLDTYFSTIDRRDEFLHRLGRVAGRYLQNIPSPMADRVVKPLTQSDVVEAVARTIASAINERRRASAQKQKSGGLVAPD